jgi:hypothetical protein
MPPLWIIIYKSSWLERPSQSDKKLIEGEFHMRISWGTVSRSGMVIQGDPGR